MKKKPPVARFPTPKTVAQPDDRSWHNGGDIEIGFYARSLHQAAKKLVAALDLTPNPKTAWDACPVILLYRQALELQLKSLVGEGCNFLPTPTDPLTLAKTRSLRWLAQLVCQIVRVARLENEFKCECVATLAEFTGLVNNLEELDPVAVLTQSANRRTDCWVPDQLLPPNVLRLAAKLDSLIGLLESTTDALAAMGDQASDEETFHLGDDFKPTTIQ